MIITQAFSCVNPPSSGMPEAPRVMIHHKGPPRSFYLIHKIKAKRVKVPYGVSSASRILCRPVLLRHYDTVRRCLSTVLGLTTSQREVVLRLLRLYAYYGQVYPKEGQITADPGCSKATYWRTIKLLSDKGLLTVVNRYVRREKAQISNLYLLDKLILLIAMYLQESGKRLSARALKRFSGWSGSEFWAFVWNPLAEFHIIPAA